METLQQQPSFGAGCDVGGGGGGGARGARGARGALDSAGESRLGIPPPADVFGPAKIGVGSKDLPAPGLRSPGIKVEFHGGDHGAGPGVGPGAAAARAGDDDRPSLIHPQSAPATVQQFQSPMRQHKRTPSQHREVKETLNARSEYTSDEVDGRSHLVINQYTILEEIGRGSYGAVHRAVDQFGQEYAVKEFSKTRLRKRAQSNILRRGPRGPRRPPRFLPGPGPGPGSGMDSAVSDQLSDQKAEEAKDSLFLIREEIAIMKKLNHPNLVQLIEVLDDPEEDSLYMVLEMCKKGVIMKVGLEETAKPYVEEECRCWFRDLILGIEYLHAQGVVHRDIKPDNLLLTDDDVLKIVDFGVSEMFEKVEAMRTAKSAGSPAFLPPELCVARHGDVSGTAADIWSMGVSLYCLRYGRIPFNRPGVLEMYEAVKMDTAVLPEDENPHFKDLMRRLMEKDPEQRITMPDIREHPWVTKEGADPLLSAEENSSDLVEPPNELEVSHAFTRRMSHLLCVMKAISNFKALLSSRSRLNSPRFNSPRLKLSPSDAASPTQPYHAPGFSKHKPKPSMDEQEFAELKRANEGHAARLLEERKRVLHDRGSNAVGGPYRHAVPAPEDDRLNEPLPTTTEPEPRRHGEPPASWTAPPVLGIGTGAVGGHPGFPPHPDFSTQVAMSPDGDGDELVVADSPTAVDFDVYDRAYGEEVERIKRSGGRPSVFMTWHLGDKEGLRGDELVDVVEGEARRGASGETAKEAFRTGRFADLVAQTIKETKERAQEGGGEDGELSYEGRQEARPGREECGAD